MKIAILTLSTLAFFSTTAFAETKPTVPAKEPAKYLKPQAFQKPNIVGKVAATQVKSPHIKTSMVTA